jgi:hypothetical protein
VTGVVAEISRSAEALKELTIGWMSAVRPSRQPPCPEEPPQAASRRGGFLRMRTFLNAINDTPHAEERLQGASRSTHGVDAGPGSPSSAILSQLHSGFVTAS